MMRIWGRVYAEDGSYTWQKVETTAEGQNDWVYLTNLIQVLKLAPNESPFFAQYGIPAQRSLVQQIAPDFYVSLTQQQFAGFFASLLITKLPLFDPTYRINVVTNQGVKIEADVPV